MRDLCLVQLCIFDFSSLIKNLSLKNVFFYRPLMLGGWLKWSHITVQVNKRCSPIHQSVFQKWRHTYFVFSLLAPWVLPQVSISSMLNARIFHTNIVSAAFFLLHIHRKITFVQKICTFNVDEIDYRALNVPGITQYHWVPDFPVLNRLS